MTSDDKSGPGAAPAGSQPGSGSTGPQHVSGQDGTAPLGQSSPGRPLGYDSPTQVLYDAQGPAQPLPGYTAADFPAPAGVAPLPPAPTAPTALARRPRRGLGALLVAASLSAVVGAGAGVGSYAYLTDGGAAGATSPISVTTVPAAQTPVLDGTVVAAADTIQPSVVTIGVQAGQGEGVGGGVVLDDQGHILTNEHVVSAAAGTAGRSGAAGSTIAVTFHNGTTAQARVVGTSPTNDLAVIEVDGVDDLTPAVFAKSSSLQTGQAVVAAGAPLGLSESVTSGIVSNTARPVRSGDADDAVYLAVQTDAAINPGNSGGPLVDLEGRVVGINSAIAQAPGSQGGNIGLGFAIPAEQAVRTSQEIIDTGEATFPRIGVVPEPTDDGPGVPIATQVPEPVSPGGPADEAGIRAGDVILEVDGRPVDEAVELVVAITSQRPGDTITLVVQRDGQSREVDVLLDDTEVG